MNILVVCHYGLYSDLTASFVHNQVKAYAALGHQVRVIIPIPFGKRLALAGARGGPLMKRRTADGVELYYIRFLSLSNYGERHFNTPSALVSLFFLLPAILDGFSPDVIHAHALGLDSQAGAWLKKRLNIPLVVTTHGSDTFIPFSKGNLAELKRNADQPDHLVCVSSLLKQRIQDCGSSVPLSVILNGFNAQYMDPGVEKPAGSMIQADSLISRKKADVTIRAYAQLHKKYPDAVLHIVGIGDEGEHLQALCRKLGVEDGIRFHGHLSNPESLAEMAKAQFFIMPSVKEGFGIVYLEAMASGCITIGTEGEGIADLIVSGENGFLVPPDSPEAIVHSIEWCLANPIQSSAIAEQGRRTVQVMTWAILRHCGARTKNCPGHDLDKKFGAVYTPVSKVSAPVSSCFLPPVSLIQVSNLLPMKRVGVTIRAFAKLKQNYPQSVLTIAGDGTERKPLESLSKALSVEEAVIFTGRISNGEVLRHMCNSDFFVMVSSPEGFGIVYLEAMASGCITIGTEGEGIADLIVSGENGFLVPPDDPEAIAEAIQWCLAHPWEAAAIAERGRQAALGLTWGKNAAQYISLFQSLKERTYYQ